MPTPGVERSRHLALAWSVVASGGTEYADLRIGEASLSARGVAIGTDPEPYRLEYRLRTGDRYITESLQVEAEGRGWRRTLVLDRSPAGTWQIDATSEGGDRFDRPPGGDAAALSDALDCDLGRCPVTNSMPVLRHGLLDGGGPIDFVMAWVSVPELSVHPSHQRYTFVRREGDLVVVRYHGRHREFTGELTFDDDGVIVTYPDLAQRLSG
ncbi:MAG: putative glycolipid-binding domain-containing protein [Chloroflexi bacterium]|nr:putative glycolipid-binding domain-containing protein [Chloroflexota bacterium]